MVKPELIEKEHARVTHPNQESPAIDAALLDETLAVAATGHSIWRTPPSDIEYFFLTRALKSGPVARADGARNARE